MLTLHEWETFYVIVGSSAAALTGLQFVVIALGAESRTGGEAEVAAFGTPTIVHFCAVLTVAAIVAVPGQSPASFSICLSLAGAAGVGYAIAVAIRARRTTNYVPVFEDWLWHAGFPFAAYAALLAAGIAAYAHTAAALYVVGASTLFLLLTGIHNAWDSAVWISTHRAGGD